MRRADGEAHSLAEDDGEEIRDGVCAGCDAEEDHGESPDLEIEACGGPKLEIEGDGVGIVAVLVDASDDVVAFLFREEPPASAFCSADVGKVDQEAIAHHSEEAG